MREKNNFLSLVNKVFQYIWFFSRQRSYQRTLGFTLIELQVAIANIFTHPIYLVVQDPSFIGARRL